MTTLLACFLFAVSVLSCDGRAQVYAPFVAQLPTAHWTLVESVEIWDRGNGRYQGRRIMLPARGDGYFVWHEVGHIVANTQRLNDSWAARFWRNGSPRGRTTTYGAREGPREDFADSYAATLGHTNAVDANRRQWIRQHVKYWK